MREYLLYVKEARSSVKALITPCFALDQLFWKQQDGIRLHILGKSSSLALLFALRERINRILDRERWSDQLRETIQKVAQAYGKEVNDCLRTEDAFSFFPVCSPAHPPTNPPKDPTSANLPMQAVHAQNLNMQLIHAQAAELSQSLAGRALLLEELRYISKLQDETIMMILQYLVLTGITDWQPGVAMRIHKNWWRHRLILSCQRCGAEGDAIQVTSCKSCSQLCAYCSRCLNMGRSKCCTPYICTPIGTNQPAAKAIHTHSLLKWQGTFSALQADAAGRALEFVRGSANSADSAFLIWAVCGAGKTELIFPAVNHVLSSGGKVLLATPRKDVVLELAPRLREVFPEVSIRSIHGSSLEKWDEGQFIIATTHQTMRFYQAFQLIIVDEVDAFPLHNNQMLYRAVERARQTEGKMIYLSATPPDNLRKRLAKATRNHLSCHSPTHVLIPKRYHGYPLPVPSLLQVPRWEEKLKRNVRLVGLLTAIDQSFQQDRQVFVFVPRVSEVPPVLAYLQKQFPHDAERMEGVYASDPLREEKVLKFRKKDYRLLVTTTILERGVTIPRSDVIVLGADEAIFDEASLVQIAGRVGRSADAPDGKVVFLIKERTQPTRDAIKQIEQMNRLAFPSSSVRECR